MARDEARLFCSRWRDDDWRVLSIEAQWLYDTILTQVDLSRCGVLTWTPGRLSKLAGNGSTKKVLSARDELAARRYLLVDDDTEEVMVRTLVKHDGILDQPNMVLAMAHDFCHIHSQGLREALLQGLPEGFVEGFPERFPKAYANGVFDKLPKGFRDAYGESRGRACVPQAPSPKPQAPSPKPQLANGAEAPSPERTNGVVVARSPDHLWDALVSAVGHEGDWTKSERGAWNAAAKQLRDVGATADEVLDRCHTYRRRWPDVSLTPTALVKHWGELAVKPPPSEPKAWGDLRELAGGT